MFVVSLEDCRHVAWIQTHIVKRYSRKNVSSSSKIPLSLSCYPLHGGKKTFTLMKLHPHLWTAHFPCIQIYIPLDFHTILPPAPIQCKWGLVSSIVPQLIHYSCGVLLSRGNSVVLQEDGVLWFMSASCNPDACLLPSSIFDNGCTHSIKATCPI